MRPSVMVRILAQAVQSRRLAMDMSLQAAARVSAVHLNSLWSFENGLVCPSVTTYYHVLRSLGVSEVTIGGGRPLLV